MRACASCGGGLEHRRPHALYCSRLCKGRATERRRTARGWYVLKHARLRAAALAAVGDACAACGSTSLLEIDHVNGNGGEHRRRESHFQMYRDLASRGLLPAYAPGGEFELRLLCRPCHLDTLRAPVGR